MTLNASNLEVGWMVQSISWRILALVSLFYSTKIGNWISYNSDQFDQDPITFLFLKLVIDEFQKQWVQGGSYFQNLPNQIDPARQHCRVSFFSTKFLNYLLQITRDGDGGLIKNFGQNG